MRDPAGSRWRLVDPSGIRIRRFGDDALVFNPVTWETHLLNGVGMRVLDALSTGAKDEAELVAEIFTTDGGSEAIAAKRDEIARFLDELGKLELAEPNDGSPR
ncbi:MAG: HPr-rel-A system PqqD family peptide chaperone [Gammaproteobacteria bacterium]